MICSKLFINRTQRPLIADAVKIKKSRSHLNIKILVQVHGGSDVQPADNHQYVEDLDEDSTPKLGQKIFFGIASIRSRSAFSSGSILE